MDNAILILLGIYFLEHLVLYFGLLVNLRRPGEAGGSLPFVSVIVAAKDEENNIAACIESLLELDYPDDKLEIVLVNDRSTDRTKEIMLRYTEANGVLTYLEINSVTGALKGKVNALAQAIESAKGEIIFTTDADIKVKPTWISGMIKYYDSDTGVVSSYSTIAPKNLYWGLQSFDWLYLLGIASGGDGIGMPISCVGNNMSYLKETYEKVGGYSKIKYSITEDFMLLQTITKQTNWKSKFPVNIDIMNETYPCADIGELYRQKKRWAKGGLGSRTAGMFVGAMAWLSGLVLFMGWIFALKPYLIFAAGKCIVDAFFVYPAVKEFRMWKVYLYLPFFEIYMALYVFLMPFILIVDRNVIWKQQKV